MKRLLVLLKIVIIIIFICPIIVHANDNEEIGGLMGLAEWLIDVTNEGFSGYQEMFIKEIEQLFGRVEDDIQKLGKIMVGFFAVIAIISKIDNFENFTFITIAPAFVFLVVGLIVIDNIGTIFDFFRTLTEGLANAIGITDGGFISFKVIKDSYLEVAQRYGGNRIVSFIVSSITQVVFLIIALVGLLAYIVVLTVVLIVEIKIGVFKLLAPVMLSGFGAKITSNYSYNFLQGVFKTHLQLFYIQAAIAVFTSLIANPGNAFIMTLIVVIGIYVAMLGGARMMFGFLQGKM